MKHMIASVAVAGTLAACGGENNQNYETSQVPSAEAVTLTVGKTISKTTAEVASLATVANFVPTGLITTNGTYANCSYDAGTNTLTITPKAPDIEAPTDICTATFVDASGKTLGPVNVNLKDIDNKAPVLATLTPLSTTAGVAWNQVLPAATDAGNITYAVKRADGTTVPLTGTDYTFDPVTRTLRGDATISTSEILTYTATDAANNLSTQSLSNTVDHLGTASISGPASSLSGTITLTLSANDTDGIASWTVTSENIGANGIRGGIITQRGVGTGNPPATLNTTIGTSVGNTVEYTFTITDTAGKTATSIWNVLRI